jgi:peroxiredoxin
MPPPLVKPQGISCMIRSAIAILLVASFAVAPAQAGKYNRKLSIGAAAPAFKDLDGIDGKKHALDDFKSKDVVVLVITSNECPVARSYEDRLIAFTKKYEGKVAVAAINLSPGDEEELPQMKERAKKRAFNFVYLRDASQAVGRALGASKTPECFVLNKDRKIVYMGSLDDDWLNQEVKEKYLESAVEATLMGKKLAKAETQAYGCSIVYKKKKD